MIDKKKLSKYAGITILSSAILVGGIHIVYEENFESHLENNCTISKLFGMDHRINKILESDEDIDNIKYISDGETYEIYIDGSVKSISGPSFIISRIGKRIISDNCYSYGDLRVVYLDKKGNIDHIEYLNSSYQLSDEMVLV